MVTLVSHNKYVLLHTIDLATSKGTSYRQR